MKQRDHALMEDTSRAAREASPEALRRFQESAYGLSAHWGLYSLSTRGNEWIYFNERIPYAVYRERMKVFHPSRFHAQEWADLIVESGMRFLLITSKHHDGFCLWDSDHTDFKITNTAFRRDVLAELAEALRARNLGLHFYYSLVDWTHPAYRNDWPCYVDYYQNQLRELCTRFGPIAGIIFDGYWPRQDFEGEEIDCFQYRGPWDLAGTYDLIHSLQPDAVVSNNTHIPPVKGEDYQVWELDLPGENTIGFNTTEVGAKPTATWWNLNTGWSYQPWNHQVRPVEDVLALIESARAKQSVMYLNVGPRPFGDIHPEEQLVLRQVGQSLRRLQPARRI